MKRWRRRALFTAAAGLVTCFIALFTARTGFFQAYWIAWIFWSAISFGSLAILLLQPLTGGAWAEAVRAPAEAAAMTIPLMALLFIPALFGLADIFPWAHSDLFQSHEWPHKQAYLTSPWFAVRGLGYFAVLTGFTVLLGLWKWRARPANPAPIGSAGLVSYGAVMLFASTDWVLSLEPQWYSTMLVVLFAIDHFLTALALVIFVTISLGAPLTTKQLHDLGNLLLAFVMFWAYVTFSQYLIIWSGNLPREISWYLHRSEGGWPRVAIVLTGIQFAVPFVLLLSRSAKRHPRILRAIAGLIFLANAVHVWWLIAPSFQTGGVHFPFLESAVFLGLGGLWTVVFLGLLEKRLVVLKEVAHV